MRTSLLFCIIFGKISLWHGCSRRKAYPNIEEILLPFRGRVKIQGDLVRELKAAGNPDFDVKKAVQELKARQKELEDEELKMRPKEIWIGQKWKIC